MRLRTTKTIYLLSYVVAIGSLGLSQQLGLLVLFACYSILYAHWIDASLRGFGKTRR